MWNCNIGEIRNYVGNWGLRERRSYVKGRKGDGNDRGDRYFWIRKEGKDKERKGGSKRDWKYNKGKRVYLIDGGDGRELGK